MFYGEFRRKDMMDSSSDFTTARGLWSNHSVVQSKENQQLLQLMKQESRVSSQQRKQKETKYGAASLPPTYKSVQKTQPRMSRRRSAESCQRGSSYQRDQFHPAPTRDLEKEKRRLQSILATGKEELSEISSEKTTKKKTKDKEEPDQYEEVLNEIEERKQFLADMASLGQEGAYVGIITSEISQKLRELELLDKDGRSKQRKDSQ